MNTPRVAADNSADVEIAHRIRNALIVNGIEHKALAEKSGLSYSTLRRSIDQNRDDRRSLTIQELGRIASALHVQPYALLPASITGCAA